MGYETDTPRCPSCGTPYQDHLGLIGTCRENEQARRALRVIHTWAEYAVEHGDLPAPMDLTTLVLELTSKTLWPGGRTMQELYDKIKNTVAMFDFLIFRNID